MNSLPSNIEEKLSKLPVIDMGNSEAFNAIVYSDDFNEIFHYYKENFMDGVLLNKPDMYQRISLYLAVTNQDDKLLEQTDNVLFQRPVPSMEDFLMDNFYQGRLTPSMYPYWKDKLMGDIFQPNSPVRKVIFEGCIGSGKTVTARKVMVYVLYRALCLRYARATFGVGKESTLANFIISVTLKQGVDTNWRPIIEMMGNMPCFQRVMSIKAFDNFNLEDPFCPIPFYVEKSNSTIFYPNNMILTVGSRINHLVGYDVINSFCDEINEKGSDEAVALLNSIDGRFSSRFEGSDFVFQSVASSARATNSPMGEYVKKLPKDDPKICRFNPMLWDVKPDPDFRGDGTTFPVFVGNGTIPSRMITVEDEIKEVESEEYVPPVGCLVIHVPTPYKNKFEMQLDQSIRDLAGIATFDNALVFRDTASIEDNRFSPELELEANVGENTKLVDLLPKNMFERRSLDGKVVMRRAPSSNRYIHVDLSIAGDQCDTAVCMLHKEWTTNKYTGQKEICFVIDFILFISAKNKVDIEAVQNLCLDLVLEKGVIIHTISADQFQSATSLNRWELSGCFSEVNKLSVDNKIEPWSNAATLMDAGRIKGGVCPKLRKELESLMYIKGKVQRGSMAVLKDGADALIGAIYNAQMNYRDEPTFEYASGVGGRPMVRMEDFINPHNSMLVDF